MPDGPKRSAIIPTLRYRDANAALEWLPKAFGFETLFQADGPDGTVGHAELAYGTGVVMLGQARGDLPAGYTTATFDVGVSEGIYVVVDDVDAHYRQAAAAGAEIVEAPTDRDYGSREYTALDPEGKLWSFGTYQP